MVDLEAWEESAAGASGKMSHKRIDLFNKIINWLHERHYSVLYLTADLLFRYYLLTL